MRCFLIVSFWFCFLSVVAQNNDKKSRQVMLKVDSVLDVHLKMSTDTNYIVRPTTNWTLKVRERGYGNFVMVRGDMYDIGPFESKINTPLKNTIGVSVNYRGLSLSLSLNPAKLLGNDASRNYNLSYFNNRFGVDASYLSTDNLTTEISYGDKKKKMKLTDSDLQQLSVSTYYIFNGRKFSYPAAFNHSWIQRRSAGSFLVSAGFYTGCFNSSLDVKSSFIPSEKKISMKHVSIGGGYAYNYIPNKHWLLHASFIPHVIVWYDYRYSVTLDPNTSLPLEKNIPYRFPCFRGDGRFAMTYNWKKYFTGLSSVVQSTLVGRDNKELSAGNTEWKIEVFFGLRF